MTLTPAIKELLDKARLTDGTFVSGNDRNFYFDNEAEVLALLSVVAAEEGRKYEELVKLHREWVEARKAWAERPSSACAFVRVRDTEDALAQWEAK